MVALARHLVTFSIEQYLSGERGSTIRHEYWGGEIFAMAGGSEAHVQIAANLGASLVVQLRGKPCDARGADQRLHIEAADVLTYPDQLVTCPPHQRSATDNLSLADATLIAEILSPSTAAYDRGAKFEAYKLLPSLSYYLLIAQDAVEVELWTRQAGGAEWTSRRFDTLDEVCELPALGCAVPLAELYDRVFSAQA